MKPPLEPGVPLSSARLRRRLLLLAAAMLAVVALAIGWTATPLRDWLDVDSVVSGLRRFGEAFGPLAAALGFALAMTLAVPLTFLSLVALVAFGPWAGFGCAMAGALLGAAASYGIGAFLGHAVLVRLAGPRINMLSQRMARRGLVAVILVRLVPVAPFAIINMVAGASHIRLRDLVLGTAIGITPGTAGHDGVRRSDHGCAARTDTVDLCAVGPGRAADRRRCVGLAALVAPGRPIADRLPGVSRRRWPTGRPLRAARRPCLSAPS